MPLRTQEMSQEQALAIANDLLKAFKLIGNVIPLRLSTFISGNEQIIHKVYIDCSCTPKKVRITEEHQFYIPDDYYDDNIYLLFWDSRVFEIILFDSPAAEGACSSLPNYDKNAYVFCSIKELRSAHGKVKYEMFFGFDIEKNIFVELFAINHYNINNFIREVEDSIGAIEELLKGRTIF